MSATSVELIVPETLNAKDVFVATGGAERMIESVETKVRKILEDRVAAALAAGRDPKDYMASEADREVVRSLAYKVTRSKTALDDLGKDFVSEMKKQAGLVDANRRLIRERLDALRDDVRAPLDAWEAKEATRVSEHKAAMDILTMLGRDLGNLTPDQCDLRLKTVAEAAERAWEEFAPLAETTTEAATKAIMETRAAAVQRAAERQELEDLRRRQRERDEQDARDAAARAQQEVAERDAEAARVREAKRQQDALDKAERDRVAGMEREERQKAAALAAAEKAVEDERRRVATEQERDRVASAKRAADEENRTKVNNAVKAELSNVGLTLKDSQLVLEAIIDGKIPHVTLKY